MYVCIYLFIYFSKINYDDIKFNCFIQINIYNLYNSYKAIMDESKKLLYYIGVLITWFMYM